MFIMRRFKYRYQQTDKLTPIKRDQLMKYLRNNPMITDVSTTASVLTIEAIKRGFTQDDTLLLGMELARAIDLLKD